MTRQVSAAFPEGNWTHAFDGATVEAAIAYLQKFPADAKLLLALYEYDCCGIIVQTRLETPEEAEERLKKEEAQREASINYHKKALKTLGVEI